MAMETISTLDWKVFFVNHFLAFDSAHIFLNNNSFYNHLSQMKISSICVNQQNDTIFHILDKSLKLKITNLVKTQSSKCKQNFSKCSQSSLIERGWQKDASTAASRKKSPPPWTCFLYRGRTCSSIFATFQLLQCTLLLYGGEQLKLPRLGHPSLST